MMFSGQGGDLVLSVERVLEVTGSKVGEPVRATRCERVIKYNWV